MGKMTIEDHESLARHLVDLLIEKLGPEGTSAQLATALTSLMAFALLEVFPQQNSEGRGVLDIAAEQLPHHPARQWKNERQYLKFEREQGHGKTDGQ